jgi:hypothetical protein
MEVYFHAFYNFAESDALDNKSIQQSKLWFLLVNDLVFSKYSTAQKSLESPFC